MGSQRGASISAGSNLAEGMGPSCSLIADSDLVVLGRIGTAFGVRGWVHLYSFTEDANALLAYHSWYLRRHPKNSPILPITVLDVKLHGDHFIAQFQGCNDREAALSWTHADILVKRDQLPELPEGEFYLNDLMGLTVFNQQNHFFGSVVDFMETGANDVLVISREASAENAKKTFLIPYIPEKYIIEVDLENRKLLVDWEEDYLN